MTVSRRSISILLVGIIGILSIAAPVAAQTGTETLTLDNGMEIILKENHSSPMVANLIFVKSGSKYESRYENGLTHFLEHLLFDGTVNQTREQLDGSIRNLGGYLNAFTRKDLTAFLVLLPKQYIDYGMTVQADMLFCSLIPEEELPKERKVVIEEINRSADSPGAAAEAFFIEKAYAGTGYDRPVLGYEPFISNIPRQAIVAYWKKYYRPDNMVMLVIGDFETAQMKETVSDIFGRFQKTTPPDTAETGTSHAKLLGIEKSPGTVLSGRTVYDTVANVASTYLNISFAAPHHADPDYLPFSLLADYLALEEISPVKTALLSGADPLAQEVSITLETKAEFSRLNVSIITESGDRSEEIISTIVGELSRLNSLVADPEEIRGIKTSIKCDDIYYAEKLHYYGFIIAPMMMTTGWEFIQKYPELLDQIEWDQCRQVADKWFGESNYIATVVRPVGESGKTAYLPSELTAEEVTDYFSSAEFPEYDLSAATHLEYPTTDSVSFELADDAAYHSETLANGLTVIIKSSPDSRVFAVNVLGKNRTAGEPTDKTGITDFVNRCLEKGTMSRSASQMSKDMTAIGANITLYDNPWIPYDDRYTTRRYSFIKFETIDEYAQQGFGLFADMLLYPAFDPDEVEKVRKSMQGVIGRNTASPSKVARDLFYKTLFENKPYAASIMGSFRSIGSITADDLRSHHAHFYSPENMIMTIGTNRAIPEVLGWVERTFGRMASSGHTLPSGEMPDQLTTVKKAHVDLDKEQIGIYLGSVLPGANSNDAAALAVATSILSSRLYLNLREKQGLAYSTGAGSRFDTEFGWYYCVIGTSAENYQRALDGLILQINKLKLDGPTAKEVAQARNSLWGRLMSAKLSRINQAYYLAVDNYLGRAIGHDKEFLGQLEEVTVESVRRVASVYFRTDNYVLATAGRMP